MPHGASAHGPAEYRPSSGTNARRDRLVAHSPLMEPAVTRLIPCSLALATCLFATACAGPQIAGVEPIDGVISGQCNTGMVRGAVGLAASDATLQRARVDSDSTEVQVVRGAADRPGTATLPEAQETSTGGSRLTVETGRNNAITALRCG